MYLKCFEQSNGLDTALYKNLPFFLNIITYVKISVETVLMFHSGVSVKCCVLQGKEAGRCGGRCTNLTAPSLE